MVLSIDDWDRATRGGEVRKGGKHVRVAEHVVVIGVPDEVGAVVECEYVAEVLTTEVIPGGAREDGVAEIGLVGGGEIDGCVALVVECAPGCVVCFVVAYDDEAPAWDGAELVEERGWVEYGCYYCPAGAVEVVG